MAPLLGLSGSRLANQRRVPIAAAGTSDTRTGVAGRTGLCVRVSGPVNRTGGLFLSAISVDEIYGTFQDITREIHFQTISYVCALGKINVAFNAEIQIVSSKSQLRQANPDARNIKLLDTKATGDHSTPRVYLIFTGQGKGRKGMQQASLSGEWIKERSEKVRR